jgi:hypothetical protein
MSSYANRRIVDGRMWSWVYLSSDSSLTDADRDTIALEAIRMDNRGTRRKSIKGENFEGHMVRRERGLLGSFSGTEYRADIETDDGEMRISLLMSKGQRSGRYHN